MNENATPAPPAGYVARFSRTTEGVGVEYVYFPLSNATWVKPPSNGDADFNADEWVYEDTTYDPTLNRAPADKRPSI
jgi:hypothetical protein